MSSNQLYIGLMSGTSLDALDAVIVDFAEGKNRLIAQHALSLPGEYQTGVNNLILQPDWELYGQIHEQLALLSVQAVNEVIAKANLTHKDIQAIGSHGQTIWHQPGSSGTPDSPSTPNSSGSSSLPSSPTSLGTFSLQLGDPNKIAALTGIPVITDCRGKDIAYSGQGAPLVPAFHQAVLSHANKTRVIANIGGIANITVLPPSTQHTETAQSVIGYDTGPGNGLMNAWIQYHHNQPWDEAGSLAAAGTTNNQLLKAMLADDYFSLSAPKSTGREYFNWNWLQSFTAIHDMSTADVQRTLCELTVHSLAQEVMLYHADELLLCGGGVHNSTLVKLLKAELKDVHITSTDACGFPADWLEAMAFAWLAKQRMERQPGNLPSVTGATKATILGAVYLP